MMRCGPPTFWMPSVDKVLDVATHFSWFEYIDATAMFHNYMMTESLQPYAGVDVYCIDKGNATHCKIWTRMPWA